MDDGRDRPALTSCYVGPTPLPAQPQLSAFASFQTLLNTSRLEPHGQVVIVVARAPVADDSIEETSCRGGRRSAVGVVEVVGGARAVVVSNQNRATDHTAQSIARGSDI